MEFPATSHTHHARWIHLDPHDEGRLFVAIEAGALIFSPDGGKTWRDRVPGGPQDTHQLVTHRSTTARMYAAAGDGYFESTDGGCTWQNPEEGLEHRYVWNVAVDSGDADVRIVSCAASPRQSHGKQDAESFIYRRTADSNWREVRDGLPDPVGRRTALLAAHPSASGAFYAVWEEAVLHSNDAGASWRPIEVNWPQGFQVGEPRGLAIVTAD